MGLPFWTYWAISQQNLQMHSRTPLTWVSVPFLGPPLPAYEFAQAVKTYYYLIAYQTLQNFCHVDCPSLHNCHHSAQSKNYWCSIFITIYFDQTDGKSSVLASSPSYHPQTLVATEFLREKDVNGICDSWRFTYGIYRPTYIPLPFVNIEFGWHFRVSVTIATVLGGPFRPFSLFVITSFLQETWICFVCSACSVFDHIAFPGNFSSVLRMFLFPIYVPSPVSQHDPSCFPNLWSYLVFSRPHKYQNHTCLVLFAFVIHILFLLSLPQPLSVSINRNFVAFWFILESSLHRSILTHTRLTLWPVNNIWSWSLLLALPEPLFFQCFPNCNHFA